MPRILLSLWRFMQILADGNPTGTEGWFTVGGYDDKESRRLADILADAIHRRLSIRNKGSFPETANRLGGLYITEWKAPSALIELAFLQGDAELLRNRRVDFGRALAEALLIYVGLPVTCADQAVLGQTPIGIFFPYERKTNDVILINEGLVAWSKS